MADELSIVKTRPEEEPPPDPVETPAQPALSIVSERGASDRPPFDPDDYFDASLKVGTPDEPGWFSKMWDWAGDRRSDNKKFTDEERRELTKHSIKRNREMFSNEGYGQFSFGNAKPPSHSSLVRAGLEEPPENSAEASLLPYLKDQPDKSRKPLAKDSRLNMERAKWQTYPKDPAGFLIDPTRKLLLNDDGSMSTEVSITIEAEGWWYNIPSIVNGKKVDQAAALEDANSQMKKGWMFPRFKTVEEAEQQAQARSDAIMDARHGWLKGEGLPQTDEEWAEFMGDQEEKEEDPWGTVIWDTVTSIPAMFKRQYGGAKAFFNAPRDLAYILEAAADQGVPPEDSFALEVEAYVQGKDPAKLYKEMIDETMANEGFQEGMRAHREAAEYMEAYRPNVKEESVKYYAGAILEGTINMVPALVASAITRNPTVGAALMGSQVFADQYADSIEKGRSHSQATNDATVMAAVETLTERIPLGILTKEGGTLLKRALKAGGAEAIQESITALIQEAYSLGIIDDAMTLGEAVMQMVGTEEGRAMLRRSAIIGAGVGGTLASMTHPLYGGMTAEDVATKPPQIRPKKAKLPSEKDTEITQEEADDMGLEKVDVTLELLERVGSGDSLTIDEQYTLTEEGYGRFINDGDNVVMNPKGMQALKQMRDGKSLEDVEFEPKVRRHVRDEEIEAEITVEPDITLPAEELQRVEGTLVDEDATPIVVWRGEHGLREDQDEEFQTRVGSLSFGSLKTATTYAKEPNNRTKDMIAQDPRVRGYTLSMKKPWIDTQDDPFVDLSHIRRTMKPADVRYVLENFADEITNTNNWQENFEDEFGSPIEVLERAPQRVDNLYLSLYDILDDAKMITRLKTLGFDGAIHQGMGENFDEIEYRVFDAEQATPLPEIEITAVGLDEGRLEEIINKDSIGSEAQQRRRIADAASRAEDATEAQKKAGNYKKGHIRFHGLPITIENEKGSVRRGKTWKQTMAHHYGYIKGIQGKDKDQLDVFIGPSPQSQKVFIVNQKKNHDQPISEGNLDEHKVMLGFDSYEKALKGYWANYPDKWRGAGSVSVMTMPQFKQWIDTPFTTLMAPKMELTEQGVTFSHDEYVGDMKYIRNTEGAEDFGETYQQHIEPAGTYMLHNEEPGELGPTWEQGTIAIKWPLVIPLNSKGSNVDKIYDQNSWKKVLSDQYGGLTGQALTDAIRADGYDAIITVSIDNKSIPYETREIVALKPLSEMKAAPRKHRRPTTNQGQGTPVATVQNALKPIYKFFRTVPPVRVVEAIEDLPKHLQRSLETDEDRRNTTGFYDQGPLMDTVYIVANNVTDTQEAIETMIHEVIGHFGIHQVIEPWEFSRVMDKIAESFPKEVRSVAKTYDLDWNNIDERRVAAEEYLAHTAQRLLAGRKVSSKMRAMIDAIVKAIRNFMLKVTGKPTLFTEGQIHSMIAAASEYVHTPGGFRRDKQRARRRYVKTPAYFSRLWNAFNDADMKSGSPQAWDQFIKSQINKGKFKATEATWLRFVVKDPKDPEQTTWFEEVTWNDLYRLATSRQWTGAAVEDTLPEVENMLPKDIYATLIKQREMRRDLTVLTEKAVEAQKEAFDVAMPGVTKEMEEHNYTAREVFNAWKDEHKAEQYLTPNEQRDLAAMESEWEELTHQLETFGRTQPKKIPKDAVMSYIERNGVEISIRDASEGGDPDGEPAFEESYPDETEEPDEDAWYEHWEEIREGHWGSYYDDALREVHESHDWDPDLEADPDIEAEEDMDIEELNEALGAWDGTSVNDMEEEANERTTESIEEDYYSEERNEWETKNTKKTWYSGNYFITTDSDGDYAVSHSDEGDIGYNADFDAAVDLATEHHQSAGGGQRWKEYMLSPAGEDYQEWLFRWENPDNTVFQESGHWGDEEDNYVAHARFDVRQDENGDAVIYVDELQSDWLQEVRDVVEAKLDEVFNDHTYDQNFVNSDGTIGGGEDWDGTPLRDMYAEAKDRAGADPERQKKLEKEAAALYELFAQHKGDLQDNLGGVGEAVNEEMVTLLSELIQGQGNTEARAFLMNVKQEARKIVDNAERRHDELTTIFMDQEAEKLGLYGTGLTDSENMLFVAYRREAKLLAGGLAPSDLEGEERTEFDERVRERSKDEGLLTFLQWQAMEQGRMLKMMDVIWDAPRESPEQGQTWQDYLHSRTGVDMARIDSREWETHPRDLKDYTTGDLAEARANAEDQAHIDLMEDTSDEAPPSAKAYQRFMKGDFWQGAWETRITKIFEDERELSRTAGNAFSLWVSLSEAMEKVQKSVQPGSKWSGLEKTTIEPFDYEMDARVRSEILRNVLEFSELKGKADRAGEGMVFPPFEKDWQLLVMKGMIHEGMRRGHNSIFISKGEVHGVRWSGGQATDTVVWAKNVPEGVTDELTRDLFTGKPTEQKPPPVTYALTYPDAGRTDEIAENDLRKNVGDRAAAAIKTAAKTAETGTIRAEDIGLKSIIVPTTTGGKRLTGGRKIYNEILPNMVNKFLKPYKARMELGWVKGPGSIADADTDPERSGLAVRRGPAKGGVYQKWLDAKVRPLTDEEMEDTPMVQVTGPAAVEKVKAEVAKRWLPEVNAPDPSVPRVEGVFRSDIPQWDGTVWGIELGDGEIATIAGAYRPWEADAWQYLEEQQKVLSQKEWGYEAWEIKFTPELKKAMETGFPLFAKKGGKKRTGDPGLDDALNWAERNIGPSGPRSLEILQDRINQVLSMENKQAKLEQAMLDQFAGLKWAIRQTHGHDLPAEKSAYKQAHFTTSQDSQMYVFLTHGIPYWEAVGAEGGTITQIKPGSKGLLEVLEPVADKIQFWGYWMAARRANRLLKEGREALFTQERIDELLKLGERFPEFQDAADAYNDWKTEFLDWAEGAGVINSETRPLWDQADYVPFYRLKSDEMGGSFSKNSGMGGAGIANVTQPIKRLLGSKHPLGDILENIIVNFTHIADTAMKNKAAQLAVENLAGSGLIDPISGKEWMKQEFIPLDELKRKLKQAGVDWQAMDQEALVAMQKMWTLQTPEGDDVISVLYDGKKKYFRVKEETLLRSLTAINEKKFSSLLGRMGMWLPRKIKRLGTTMITLAPDFMAANWFRDVFMAFTNSRHAKMPKPWSGMLGAWKAFTKSPEMVSMMAAGGAFYSGYINANDPVSTAKALKRALRQTGFKNRILNAPWLLFHFYNDIGAASENANRIGSAYTPAIKAGAGKAEAVWESKDLMNFAKHGDHVMMQFFAQSVMFLNARIQGLTRYGQRFGEAPGLTFTKSLMYSMAVLLVWLKNKDDDRYKGLPDEEKDMYIHFWVNGKHWRLPKAFEVGMVFGVGVERMFEYFYSNEDDAGKVAIDRLYFVLGEVFNFFNPQTLVPLPQFIQPIFEASSNYNTFFQAPIVPEYMQDVAAVKPELTFRASTSPTMRELAKIMPAFSPEMLKNPMLMQHLVRGYFGTLGAYVMVMADELVRSGFDYPARPDLRWSQVPVVGRFYRGEDPPSRTNFEEIMYEVRNNARQIERAVNQMESLEMDDEIDKFMEAGSKYDRDFTNQEILDAARAMEGSYNQIKQLRKETNQLWEDEDMTGEQKLRELNRIYQDKLENAKDAWMERPGANIQFDALEQTLIDMPPQMRKGFLVEQGLESTSDLIAVLPKKPDARLRSIYRENSA